ncbi:MAG: PH domain-containing protein [Halanaeroarchaeum sp.]
MRLHRLTIPLEGAGRAVGAGVVGFTLGSVVGGYLAATDALPLVGSALGVPLGVLFGLGGLAYEVVHYRHFEYEVSVDTLDIASGVLFRRDREIPLERIQNVDIAREVLARVAGLATVKIETAGGGETEARLRYVSLAEARRVQEQIRTRKRSTSVEGATETDDETELFALDDRDLLLLSVLSFDPRLLSVILGVGPMLAPNLAPDLDTIGGATAIVLGLAGAMLAALGLWLLSAFATFVRFYGFRLTRVGDELRYERGLIQRYDGSIPLEKVQTVVLEENVLMRQFGFAALSVETAGYAPGSTTSGGSEAAVPLAARREVVALAREIEPFEMPTLSRPPTRARRRYAGRYALAVVGLTLALAVVSRLLAPVPWYLAGALLLGVPLAAERTWRHRGYGLGEDHAVTRRGFWRRRTHVVPDFRVQTVIERRSFFQRRWSLSSVVIDTASSGGLIGGDAVAIDLDESDAVTLREAVRDRLQAALGDRRSPDGAGESTPATD